MTTTSETSIPTTMHAVQLTGHGGPEMLVYSDNVPVPSPQPGEVLIRVGAAGMNNTDINTRTGWYSKSVTSGTTTDVGTDTSVDTDGGWAGAGLDFPRIQGADVAGRIVAIGASVDSVRLGERVIVRSMQSDEIEGDEASIDTSIYSCRTVGSEMDGGFAQYGTFRSSEAFPITSDLTDVELASFPCAYSTAEGLLERAGLKTGERVLITGASGGVGSAAIQLAKRRGAEVIAVASRSKWDQLGEFGADIFLDRDADLLAELGPDSVDVVADVVGGPTWPTFLEILRRRGRYATSGAIAGPIVELDLRTLYLKDLTLVGSTYQPRSVFTNLISYIERGEVRPIIAATFPLAEIGPAQEMFVAKTFAGKLVLVPPA